MIKKWKVVAPNDKQAWVQESNMLAASGELEGSIQSLRRAIARFENNTDLQDLISQKYVEIGNYEEAIQTLWAGFNNALTIDEKINWSKKLIRTSGDIGLLYEVKNKFLSLRGENPKAIAPILALYQVSDFEENLEEKFSYLKEALTINPDNDQLLSIYASLAEKSGDFAEAELVLIKASQKSKDNSVDKKLLQFYLRTGNEEKAISVLNRIKQFDSARELEIVALSMIAGGSNRVADSLLRGGLVQFPDDWRLYALLGFLMEKKGLLHEAVKYYTLVHTAENTLENLQKTDSGKRYAKMTLSSFISNFNRYKSQQYSFTIFPAQNSNYILPESIAYAGIQGEIALVRIHAITTDKALKKEIAEHMEKTQTPHLQIKSELAFQSFFKKALSIDNLPKKYRESEYFLESRITKEVGNLTHSELLSYVTDFAHNGSISGVAGVHLLSKAKSTEEYTKALEAVEMALEKNGNVSRTVFRALTAHFMKAPPERTEEELQQVQDLIVSYYESSKEYQSSLYLLGFFLETEDYERFTATLKQATSRNKWGERLPYRITSSKVIERFYNGHTTIAQIYKAEEVGVEKRLAFLKTVATQVDDYWRFRIYEVIGEKEKAQIAREEAMKDPHYRFILRYKAIDPNLEVEEIFEIAKELKDIATDKGQRAVARQILLSCASEMDEKSVRENQNLLRQELAPFMNTKNVSYYIKWFAQKFKIKVPTTAKPNTPVLATSLSGNRDSAKRKMLRYIESGQKERAAKFLADYARDAVFSNNSYYLNNFLRETERKGSFRKEALEILSQGADQDVLKAIPYYVVCVEFQEEARAKNIFKNLNDLRFPEPWRKSYEIFEKYLEDKQGVLDTIVNELKESTQSLDYYVNPPFSADYDSKAWINWLDMASAIMSELDAQEMISQEGIKINQFEPVLLALMLNQNFNSDHYNSFYQINTTDERQAPKREFANRVGKVAIKHAFTAEIGYHILNFITPKATIEGRTYLQQFLLAGGLLTESYRTQHKSYWTYLVNASGSSLDKELFTLIAGGQVDEILPQDFLTTLKGKQPNTAEFIEHLISISKLKEADLKKKIETLQSDFELPEQKEHEYFIAAQYLLPFTYKSMKAQLPELEKKIQEIFENNTHYNQGVFDELMTIYSRAEKKLSLAECEEMHLALVESVLGKKEGWGDTDLSKGSKELKKLQAFLRFDQHFSTNKNLIYLLSRSNWRYGIPSQNNNMWGLAQDLSNKIIHAKSSDTIKAMEDLNLLTDTKDFFPLSVKHSDWNDPFTFRDKQNIFQNIGSGSDSKRLKLIKDLKARNEGRFGSLFVAAMIGDYQNRRKALESLFSEYADDLVKLPDWQLSAIGFTVSEHYNYKYNSNPKLAKLNQRFAEIKREEYEKRAQVLINRLNSKDPLSSYNNQIYGLRLDVQELLNEFIYSNPEKAVEIFKGYSKAVTVYYSNGGHYSNHSYNSLQVSLFEELLVNLASQARRDNSNSPEANIDFFSFLDKALREKDINEGLSFGFNFSQESNYLMGYFVDSIDRDSDKISKRTTPWLVLDEVVKKLEEKGEEAMLSYALLNYFVREKQWKIGLEHEVVQNWEKKAPKSLLYQACMVLANYSCEIPDEGQRLERQLPLMKEYFDRLEEYPQIIAPLKVEILQQKLNSHTQKHLLQDPEWHALMMRYLPQVFNGKRSGRSLMTEKLLVNYNMVSRVKPELAREALPILYKGIAKPIIGEPAEIPERLAGEIMQLALLTNDNAIVATILQSSKGKLKGELKYVEILLRERSFKSLRALLPTSSQEYKVSSLNTLYDVKLEHALTEFKAEGVGALQLARLEIALLELDDAKNGDKPQENKVDRIARLSSTISKYKTIDKKVLLQCLTILTSWNKSVPVPELAEELLKNDTLENLIHDYYYGGNSLEVQKKLPLKVSLIATQLGKGKTDELELYAKVLENENNYYLLSQFLPTLNEIAIFEIPKLIQADNKNALNEILAFYERALASSLSRGGGNTATSMISLAKLIAGHLNRFDEVFEWRSKVGPEYREFFDDREKDSDIDYYYSKILRNSPNWLEPANKEKRVKLYKWLLQQPGTIKSAPKERALSRSNYAVDKFITQEEYVILAQDKEIPASHRKLMLQNALFYTEDEEKLAIHYHIVALGDKVEPKALVDSSIVVVNELLKEEKYAEIEEILKEIPRKNLPNKLKKKLLSVQRKINRNKK